MRRRWNGFTNDEYLAEAIRKIGGHGFKSKAEEVRLVDDVFQDPIYERHDKLG